MQALCLYQTRGQEAIIGFLSLGGGMPSFHKLISGSECPQIKDTSLIKLLRAYFPSIATK